MGIDEFDDAGLERARLALRARQGTGTRGDVTDAALARHAELTAYVEDPTGRVRRGAFTYLRDQEDERIARGAALIRRVAPGPFEDANYFAMLAHQAASLEMSYDDIATPERRPDFSRFLLGTAHAPEVNALAEILPSDRFTVVVLNSGLVEFVYQSAKVVVEALAPRRATDGRGLVQADSAPEVIKQRLASDPAPAERLYRTLAAYLFDGYPRAISHESVPVEQHPPLSLVVGLAERWIIGHEYGHGLASGAGDLVSERTEEYFADANAMVATVLSAAKLDHVPPEFPLGGAVFALTCLDLTRRALAVAALGDEDGIPAESATHPAPRDRQCALIDAFRRFFDVRYEPDGRMSDLWMRLRPEAPPDHSFTDEHVERAYAFANILGQAWPAARERLLGDHRAQRALHPFWAAAVHST